MNDARPGGVRPELLDRFMAALMKPERSGSSSGLAREKRSAIRRPFRHPERHPNATLTRDG
jgi:hypothetical protein